MCRQKPFMKKLREELKTKFPSINYSMAATGFNTSFCTY
jgi:hypothetical protein